MTIDNETILKVARECNKLHIEDEHFFSFCTRFAHRIAALQREKDAGICERLDNSLMNGCEDCAAAIRSQS